VVVVDDVLVVVVVEVVVVVGGRVVVVVGGCVVVVVDDVLVVVVLVVVGRSVVVVVVVEVVVVGGRVVVVVDGCVVVVVVEVLVVVVLVDVEVVVGAVTATVHPISVEGRMRLEFVSYRYRTVRPMEADVLAAATASKVTFATLTSPVGAIRLLLWKLETLVVPGTPVFDVGVLENSDVSPPATEATVTTFGS